MRADEAGALAVLTACRKELSKSKTVADHGRVVKLMGNGTLVEFRKAGLPV